MALQLSRHDRDRLVIVAAVVLVSALVGIAFSWLLSRLIPFPYTLHEVENGVRNGALVGGSLTAFHLFYVQTRRGEWLRRRSFIGSLALRTLLYATIITVSFVINRVASSLLYGPEMKMASYLGLPLLRDVVFSFGIFLIIFFVLEMRRLVGGRTLVNVILGRYYRPRSERRLVMLVDIKGSTALAERLGDARAHAFLTRTFFEVEQPVIEHRGEVYSYVGDLMIVTWPLDQGVEQARCIQCWLGIRKALARAGDAFVAAFGSAPAVRTAIHAGPLAIGECGDARLQIVYIGDTMNVAGRLEQMTKAMDRDCLVSEEVMQRIVMPPEIEAEPLGSLPIRGREQPLAVYSLRVEEDHGRRPLAA